MLVWAVNSAVSLRPSVGMCFQLIVLAELPSPTAEIASTLGLTELGSVVQHTNKGIFLMSGTVLGVKGA